MKACLISLNQAVLDQIIFRENNYVLHSLYKTTSLTHTHNIYFKEANIYILYLHTGRGAAFKVLSGVLGVSKACDIKG